MENELSIELREYLKRCGLSDIKIKQCSDGTRLYHDLGVYGDIAEGYMEVLAKDFHVDLGGFDFEKFFPPEFSGESALMRALLWVVPFAGSVHRQQGEWAPLALKQIERAIHSGRWE